jgi:GNAT superfamily N-acetyltransferase
MRPAATIRVATPADAPLLTELGARTFRDAFGAQNNPQDLALYLAQEFHAVRQREELQHPEWLTLVAEAGGRAVGYAQSTPAEPPVSLGPGPARFLRRLYLDQAWIGRGLGRQLLEAVAKDARTRGSAWLWLTTWERAAQARAFYQKVGFETVGETSFQVGTDTQRDVVLARPLSLAPDGPGGYYRGTPP